jgi:hypothetical protein
MRGIHEPPPFTNVKISFHKRIFHKSIHHEVTIMTSRRTFILALATTAVSGQALAQRATVATVYLNPT